MALIHKEFKENIKAKELTFNDNYFSLSGEYIYSSDGISFMAYDAFKNLNDVQSNSFSNLFLTKKQKNSDILKISNLKESEYFDFVTTLSFFNNTENDGIWLTVDKSFNVYEIDTTTSSFKLVEGRPDNYSNYLFRVHCLDDIYCQISHSFGDSIYYLSYDNGFKCITDKNNTSTKFIYQIEGNKMKLYFLYKGILHTVHCINTQNSWLLELINEEPDDSSSIFYINNAQEEINYIINSSWVKYNRKNTINSINNSSSSYDLESQFIIHHEYSDENDLVNFIPLKNHLTYQGTVTNGTTNTISTNGKFIERPLVDFRNYTFLHTGNNQETGTENITLSFTFNDQIFRLNPGDDCIFEISDNKDSVISPLYPYDSLNINDTAFIRNGAFASSTPYFSDKFFKLQNNNSKIKNYSYLCTWLYQEDENKTPVWLDRYYYPDMLSRKEALNGNNIFKFSFENIIDKISNNEYDSLLPYQKEHWDSFLNELSIHGYMDKKSDLTIEPGTMYKYSRLSSEMVKEVYDSIDNDRINIVKDQNSNDVSLESAFNLDNKTWRKISSEKFSKTNAINFNTNIYISPYKKMGIQLFGSDYKYGFNIQNRKDLTPFTYYSTSEAVYMFNNNFEVTNTFKLKEKYNSEIKYIIVGSPFDNIYIFSEDSIFILDYDLSIEKRIKYHNLIDETLLTDYSKLYATHIIQNNKNLYAVIDNKKILKIIFEPENELDRNALINARFLYPHEYYINFTLEANTSELFQTEHKIKTLYIQDNKIYAFNYDILKMSHDGDNIYGIIKENINQSDKWYYIFNQSLGRLHTSAACSKFAEFTSDISIDSISFGPDGYFGLIRGFDNEIKDRCLEIYDKTKTKIYSYPLERYEKLISFDYYRYIDSSFNEQDSFIALVSSSNTITVIEYQLKNEKINTYATLVSDKVLPTFKHIIDSNSFIRNLDENKIYFNLYFPGIKEAVSYIWDLKQAQEGWYNINVAIDTKKLIFDIKINDYLVYSFIADNKEELISKQIDAESIFNATYYYGTVGKRYGTTLNEILSTNNLISPYAISDTKIENTTLYNRILEYFEYQANRLNYGKINPLAITLPCGVRNGVEEIVRYFKYSPPGSISNKVKINISGINGINFDTEKEMLKKEILEALKAADCLTVINEIEFI